MVATRVPVRLTKRRIAVVAASFVGGASAALFVLFAHPRSPSFWRHFSELWGFLWFWERGTLCAMLWGLVVAAALLVRRPSVANVGASRLAVVGSVAGFLTSLIVEQLDQLLGFSPLTWLGLGAGLGIALIFGAFSWLGARSAEPAVEPR